jgi:hypothetical protein
VIIGEVHVARETRTPCSSETSRQALEPGASAQVELRFQNGRNRGALAPDEKS